MPDAPSRATSLEVSMSGASNDTEAGCVFCSRIDQPEVLFETPSLYVMPDKLPTRQGHCLVIAKEHLACYAAAPEVLGELEEAKERVARFLTEAYGGEAVYVMEHGVVGQTVFHAHLHVLSGPHVPLPREYLTHPDVMPVTGWLEVVERYRQVGHYRLVEYDRERFLVRSDSPLIAIGRTWMAAFSGMTWESTPEHTGWRKYTTPADVRETERRWREWTSRRVTS
jgi:diadenosine tetraphosphate (Ap4A) HIT family hydrolase